MEFDKEKYWERRHNTKKGESKPLKGQEDPSLIIKQTPSEATIGFDNDGNFILKNRQYRRQKYKLPETEAQKRSKPKKKRKKRKGKK